MIVFDNDDSGIKSVPHFMNGDPGNCSVDLT